MNTCHRLARMALLIGLPAALTLSMTAPQSVRAAGIRYAAPSAVGNGDCSSWANACTLQNALSGAVSGDEIWVKEGAHYPGTNRTATFTLKNGVTLYGGFAGTETSRNQRNWQTHKTILSGDIDHNDINADGNNIAETWNDIQGNNAYHVVTGGGADSTAVLDGFIITAGQANDPSSDYGGGGMYNISSRPTLRNLIFSGNSAIWGGGMYNRSGSYPTLTNAAFSGNSADNGGGMYNYSSSPALTNVAFSGNSATNDGGGMVNGNSNPTLTNITFSGNSAINGGGMDNYNGNPTLTNITFSGNSAINGGGMYNSSSSNPTLTNVIMWGNTATDGRGIYNLSSNPTIAYSDVQNCGSSSFWVIACGTNGGGNIAGDPRFEDADGADNMPGTADDNLRLQLTSPAIDAGKNAAVPAGVTTDLDGNPRFVDIPTVPDKGSGAPPIVDMGAYEARLKVFLPLALRNH